MSVVPNKMLCLLEKLSRHLGILIHKLPLVVIVAMAATICLATVDDGGRDYYRPSRDDDECHRNFNTNCSCDCDCGTVETGTSCSVNSTCPSGE